MFSRRFPFRRRHTDDAGFGLIEVAFAVVLAATALSLLAAGLVVASTRSIERSRNDTVTELAYSMQETARSFNCGFEYGSEPGATLASRLALCASQLNGVMSPQPFWLQSVTTTYSWEIPALGSLNPPACQHMVGPGPRLLSPDVLRRDFTYVFRVGQREVTRTFTFRDAIPPAYVPVNDAGFSSLVVQNINPGETVDLRRNANSQIITRAPDAYNCVWFPYLPAENSPATWQYKLSSQSTWSSVTLPANTSQSRVTIAGRPT
jgi:type II secretory pathway pseudopilin PulG